MPEDVFSASVFFAMARRRCDYSMDSSDSEDKSLSSLSSDSEEEESNTAEIKRVKIEPGGLAEWSERDQPQTKAEFVKVTGPTIELSSTATVSKYVELLFDESFFKLLATRTNINHQLQSSSYKTNSKSPEYEEVTKSDMKKFLALLLLMGQMKKSHWREYWSTDPVIETPIFPQTMTRNRFEQILRFFHIADDLPTDDSQTDGSVNQVWKIKPLMDHFIPKFQSMYAPSQQLSMNEAIVPSSGNVRFRKYNPAKTTRYGVLLRMLSESETGYILNMEVYSGTGKPSIESITSVIQPYFGRWHHVYQDNYYNSVAMANMLYENQTLICGTIRKKHCLPAVIKEKSAALQRGEIAYVRNGPIMVLAWKNKSLVNMITTVHDASMKQMRNKKRVFSRAAAQPTCVLEHSRYLAGDDRTGRYLANCHIFRKTGSWYKKLSFFLINCGLYNAFILYRTHGEGKSKMRYRQFLLEVAKAWIAADGLPTQKVPKTKQQEKKENHALDKIVTPGKERPTRKCKVCAEAGLRKETRYICKECNVPLHAYKCFENYHLALNKSPKKK